MSDSSSAEEDNSGDHDVQQAVLRDVARIVEAERSRAASAGARSPSGAAPSAAAAFNPSFTHALGGMVSKYVQLFGRDMELFAKHANRSTVRADDVILCARRSPDVTQKLRDFSEAYTEKRSKDKGRSKPRKKTAAKKGTTGAGAVGRAGADGGGGDGGLLSNDESSRDSFKDREGGEGRAGSRQFSGGNANGVVGAWVGAWVVPTKTMIRTAATTPF